jgi:hypothetical protein
LPGQMEPERALKEARSKILWGDDPNDVAKFLMSQGFGSDEAKGEIAPLLLERAKAVRGAGMNKIFTGVGMMFVPVLAFVAFTMMGVFPIKIFGAAVAVGLWGAYRALGGTMMVLAPKGEKGDVSDM